MRITAGSSIRKLNMKVPFNQVKNTTTDRKSVEGRQMMRHVMNNNGMVVSGESHTINNYDS